MASSNKTALVLAGGLVGTAAYLFYSNKKESTKTYDAGQYQDTTKVPREKIYSLLPHVQRQVLLLDHAIVGQPAYSNADSAALPFINEKEAYRLELYWRSLIPNVPGRLPDRIVSAVKRFDYNMERAKQQHFADKGCRPVSSQWLLCPGTLSLEASRLYWHALYVFGIDLETYVSWRPDQWKMAWGAVKTAWNEAPATIDEFLETLGTKTGELVAATGKAAGSFAGSFTWGFLKGGIVAVAVLGGGYLLYKRLR